METLSPDTAERDWVTEASGKKTPVWGSVRGCPGESGAEGGGSGRRGARVAGPGCGVCAPARIRRRPGIGLCKKGTKKSLLQGSHLSALFADTSLLISQKILAVALKLEAEITEAVYHALGY
ncbi:hypothetical protein CapIbe_018493 [Capra ibex]